MGSLSQPSENMNILITGAGGFLGQALAQALMSDPAVSSLTLTDVVEPPIPTTSSTSSNSTSPSISTSTCSVDTQEADLTQPQSWDRLVTSSLTHVYLLHGIMSGAAETNLALGLRVNVDSMRLGLDVLRAKRPGIKVIFPSSLAVFGPPRREPGDDVVVVTEATPTQPQSSYGAQKAMMELLLNDYSRRGLLDGRIVRLPTIVVRPGQPSGAASSFCSGIIREPLAGQKSVLPVRRELELWVCSTRTVVRNLLVARDVPASAFGGPSGDSRIVNLPGITVTVQQMLDALRDVGGDKARGLVEEARDTKIEKIVGSWPARFDVARAKSLGFACDGTLSNAIREYIEDYGHGSFTS